ncbi:MAG: hypothetical protein ACI4OR_03720 [Alphaproteobacteria bacterium]
MTKKILNQSEQGSIMLEVVAVLALMGVMGAMLFRQIYQRNQELHNIQMASEIRTVKEAFAAYIQANRSYILSQCSAPQNNTVEACVISPDELARGVQEYLPDGWFSVEALQAAYTLTLWHYLQDDGSNRRVIYGMVVPTIDTLPSTGWNFRRAARVGLLVGADGGAYDPTITGGHIAGALGSWEIEAGATGADTVGKPVYAAMTGIDIFAPEYEAPDGQVNLPSAWDLVLEDAHAYNSLSVGGNADCYTFQHHTTSGNPLTVNSDNITLNNSNCQPLFWVGNDDKSANPTAGNVYVLKDLNVGADTSGKHGLKLTEEGVIKQRDGLTIDKDGRIIAAETVSAAIGDLASGEHYVLDLGHTSTLNDIRLASRGGARLSDILPNFILKEVQTFWFDEEKKVDVPQCPKDYKAAITVLPATWNNAKSTETVVTGLSTDPLDTTKNAVVTGLESGSDVVTDIDTSNNTITRRGLQKQNFSTTEVISDINEGVCVTIKYTSAGIGDHSGFQTGKTPSTSSSTTKWSVIVGYSDVNDNCAIATGSSIGAIVSTYCVWAPSLYNGNEAKCLAAGYKYQGTTCTTTHNVETEISDVVTGSELSEVRCKASGFTWKNDRCQFIYMSAAQINSMNALTGLGSRGDADDLVRLKASACKSAGYKWDGTTCSDS